MTEEKVGDEETIGDRVRTRRIELKMSQSELSRRAGVTQPTISILESNRSTTTAYIASIANALEVSALWLQTGQGDMHLRPKDYRRVHEDGAPPTMEFEIPIIRSTGSCGGSERGVDELIAQIGPVIKDQRFFTRYGVEPDATFAIVGDGDAMSRFIEHGDVVVFSRSDGDKLSSGQIYAFDTPDGPRIKRIHRRADGQVILSCDNPDKNRHPDEVYNASEAESLNRIGSYVYREG
ncbi:S24 family peptidase [Burkholderia cenocepacia]|uniref:XRE family transcriptional regulator n=1 Tax=Burkholderia cenocepacia TaxID=95486 RepID=UPI0023B9F7EE|nr:LexA family transcriptional regulator [Burkholderia cenocepacia]MDF0506582.1 S24 family peptidase [Burkholderia cenocepacia]